MLSALFGASIESEVRCRRSGEALVFNDTLLRATHAHLPDANHGIGAGSCTRKRSAFLSRCEPCGDSPAQAAAGRVLAPSRDRRSAPPASRTLFARFHPAKGRDRASCPLRAAALQRHSRYTPSLWPHAHKRGARRRRPRGPSTPRPKGEGHGRRLILSWLP
jgi:hypothetical protein